MSTHACIRLTRIKSIAISVCLAMLIASQPMAQSLEYDILWFGTIGKLTINKSTVAGQEHISTESKVKIPFYTFNWITSATIKDGLLQRSTYEQVLNDDQREYCKITRKADKDWLVEYGSGEKKNISISHTFYVSELYFKEPKNVTMVFSERLQNLWNCVN
ncbi:MAG: hypothetical protein HC819_13190 [Cyclobacteriaceae bacterium]|nr:hypothetical protein [Cyclobacteriaceae bacterium]